MSASAKQKRVQFSGHGSRRLQNPRKQDARAGDEFWHCRRVCWKKKCGNYKEPPPEGTVAPFTGFYFVYTSFVQNKIINNM